jgi:glycosyltransferase involved in cell wall biosynthesis
MRVILAFKNFAAIKHVSHIGLGVCALNTSKVLIKNKIPCEIWPVNDSNEIRQKLRCDINGKHKKPPITHVIISAPWIRTQNLNHLCDLFPKIKFVMNCHSNVGFLMADPNGTKLLREAMKLELTQENFYVSANSLKMARWITEAYGSPSLFLPNLYFMPEKCAEKHALKGHTLKIGIFGAVRPLKNIPTSVGAAIVIAEQLKMKTELYLSTGRLEGGSNTILNTCKALVADLPNVKLIEAGWLEWPDFRKLVSKMHILLTPSYSESFNIVTADGIAEGVPSVVSEAISWAPKQWISNIDEPLAIAENAVRLIKDKHSAQDGCNALSLYVKAGLNHWKEFLSPSHCKPKCHKRKKDC